MKSRLHQITFALLTLLVLMGCRKTKLIETAKANARQYGLARCDCDKLQRRDPPGDVTLCLEQMQQAKRYLTFNFEMGKFSEAEKAEVMAHADQVYQACMDEEGLSR
jgi:hypothetical protein